MRRSVLMNLLPAVIAWECVFPLALWLGLRFSYATLPAIAANSLIWTLMRHRLQARDEASKAEAGVEEP